MSFRGSAEGLAPQAVFAVVLLMLSFFGWQVLLCEPSAMTLTLFSLHNFTAVALSAPGCIQMSVIPF